MILTGKCKEAFLRYFKKRNKLKLHELEKAETVFSIQDELYQNALIIDFFDGVGIEIFVQAGIDCKTGERDGVDVEVRKKNITYDSCCENRNEATIVGIKKANEIYNKNK